MLPFPDTVDLNGQIHVFKCHSFAVSRQWKVYNSSNLIRNQINTIAKGGFYASGSLSNQIRLNVKGNITYYYLFSGPQMAIMMTQTFFQVVLH